MYFNSRSSPSSPPTLTSHKHGALRPFHQKSTCITQLTVGPYVVQSWSPNVQAYSGLAANPHSLRTFHQTSTSPEAVNVRPNMVQIWSYYPPKSGGPESLAVLRVEGAAGGKGGGGPPTLCLSRTHTLSLAHTHTLSRTHTLSLSYTHTLSLSLTVSGGREEGDLALVGGDGVGRTNPEFWG